MLGEGVLYSAILTSVQYQGNIDTPIPVPVPLHPRCASLASPKASLRKGAAMLGWRRERAGHGRVVGGPASVPALEGGRHRIQLQGQILRWLGGQAALIRATWSQICACCFSGSDSRSTNGEAGGLAARRLQPPICCTGFGAVSTSGPGVAPIHGWPTARTDMASHCSSAGQH